MEHPGASLTTPKPPEAAAQAPRLAGHDLTALAWTLVQASQARGTRGSLDRDPPQLGANEALCLGVGLGRRGENDTKRRIVARLINKGRGKRGACGLFVF